MGVEYMLVNPINKTIYDLGKGSWYDLNDSLDYLKDANLLSLHIFDYVLHRGIHGYAEMTDYVYNRLAPDLVECFKNADYSKLFIVNDCGDDTTIMRTKGYKCIGSRYYELGTTEHQQQIDFWNRHLLDEKYGRLYNADDKIKQHPDWEKY